MRGHVDLDDRGHDQHRRGDRDGHEGRRQQLVPLAGAGSRRSRRRAGGTARPAPGGRAGAGRARAGRARCRAGRRGRGCAAQGEGLGAQRERRGADHEDDGQRPRLLVDPPPGAGVLARASAGSEEPAMNPATQAKACSASTSELRSRTCAADPNVGLLVEAGEEDRRRVRDARSRRSSIRRGGARR